MSDTHLRDGAVPGWETYLASYASRVSGCPSSYAPATPCPVLTYSMLLPGRGLGGIGFSRLVPMRLRVAAYA
eukprot:3670474-Rhodomonas_salina.5